MDKKENIIFKSIKYILIILIPILIILSGKAFAAYNWYNVLMNIPNTGNTSPTGGEAPWYIDKSQTERTVTYPNPVHYQAFKNDDEQNVYIHSKAVYCCDLYSHVRSGKFDYGTYFIAGEGSGGDVKTPNEALDWAEEEVYTYPDYYVRGPGYLTPVFTYNFYDCSDGKRYITRDDVTAHFANGAKFEMDSPAYFVSVGAHMPTFYDRASALMVELFNSLADAEKANWYLNGDATSDPVSKTMPAIDEQSGPIIVIMEKEQKEDGKYGGESNVGYKEGESGTFRNNAEAYVLTAIRGLYRQGKQEYTLAQIQLAWWSLVDTGITGHDLGNPKRAGNNDYSYIKDEALAYEVYRGRYLDGNNKLKSEYYGVDSSNAEAIVDQEEQSYTVGPFTLYYPTEYDGHYFDQFVYVKGLTVRTYDETNSTTATQTLRYDEVSNDFEIKYPTNSYGITGGSGLTKKYPMSGKPFYVKIYVNGGNGFKGCGKPKKVEVSFSLEYLTTSSADYQILESNADMYAYIGHVVPSLVFDGIDNNNGLTDGDYNHTCPFDGILVNVKWKDADYVERGRYRWPGSTDTFTDPAAFRTQYGLAPDANIDAYYEDTSYWRWVQNDGVTNINVNKFCYQPYIKMSEFRYDKKALLPQKLMKTEEGERKYITILSSASVNIQMDLGGKVFEDLRRGKLNEADGYYAITSNTSGEAQDYPMEKVIVLLYRHELADSLGENEDGEFIAWTKTDADGNYRFENLNEMYKYHVEFIYNGQFYEPTKYTMYDSYNKLTNQLSGITRKTRWENSSKALESYLERDELNKKFEEIGASPTNAIPDSNGNLQYPTASRDDLEEQNVIDSLYDNNLRKSAGILLNYKIENGNLVVTDKSSKYTDYVKESLIRAYTYESYNDSEIPDYEKKTNDPVLFEDNHVYKSYESNKVDLFLYPISEVFVDKDKVKDTHTEVMQKPIKALYDELDDNSINEMHHINLGLVDREEMQLKLEKDVAAIYFEVNGKTHMYKYNKRVVGDNKVGYGLDVRAIDGYARYREDLTREIYREDYEYEADLYKNLKTIDPVSGEKSKMTEDDYNALIAAKETGELEIYVKYKIAVTLNSSLIKTRITEIVDYYDKEFTVIGNDVTGTVQQRVTSDSVVTEDEVKKYAPYYGDINTSSRIDAFEHQYAGLSSNRINISETSRYKDAKNARKAKDPQDDFLAEYNRVYLNTEDVYLDPTNANFTAYVTYRVNKTMENGKRKYVILDEAGKMTADDAAYIMASKINIAEINGYKTYYYDKTNAPNFNNEKDNYAKGEYDNDDVAGIVDKCSTPGNLEYEKKATMDVSYMDEQGNVQTHKVLTQAKNVAVEPDADMAPLLHIILNRTNTRKINGKVWEDQRVDDGKVSLGNGTYNEQDDKDILVNGVIVQLVELDRDSNGNVLEEHVWKQYKTGKTDKNAITSVMNVGVSKDTTQTEEGQYAFVGVPAGDYVVRFIYGADASSAVGTESVNYETGIVSTDGNKVFTNYITNDSVNKDEFINLENEILNQSTIYDPTGEMGNKNIHSYTGNDYKSTTYRKGYYESDSNHSVDYLEAETGNFEFSFEINENAQNISDAKDIWSRRDIVNKYSKDNLTNHRAEVLSSFENIPFDYGAESMNSLLGELYAYTYMVAESGVIDFEIEYDRTETDNKENGIGTKNKEKSGFYEVNGLDFGLERRPRAQLKTTNQVINVKITLANGNVLFDARDTATNVQWIKHIAHNPDRDNNYTIKDNYEGNKMKIPSVRSAGENGVINLTMDEELMQGARIEITYAITVANIGEVDYKTTGYYYKGEDRNPNEVVKTTPKDVLVYVGYQSEPQAKRNNLLFNQSENPQWEVIETEGGIIKPNTKTLENRTDEYDKIGFYAFMETDESRRKFETALSMKETEIDDNLLNSNLLSSAKNYNTIIHVKDDNSIVKDLVPIKVDERAQGIDDKFANDPLHTIEFIRGISSVSGEILKLSTVLSGDTKGSDMIYNNLVEIVKVSNDVGRRQNYSIVGNQDPTTIPNEIDADIAQEVSILPPFGQSQRYYYLGFGIASILIVGTLMVIAFTKKKDNDNGEMQVSGEGK